MDAQFLSASVSRAMLGEVTANLAGLYAELDGQHISITGCFFEEPTEDDRDHLSDIGGQVIADFPEKYRVSEHARRIQEISKNSIAWHFLRTEAFTDQKD